MTHTAPATDPIANARALAPRIAALGPQIDADRMLPPDLVAEMQAAGLFRINLPRSLNGLQCDPVTVARVVEEVGKADGSAAWCVMLAAQTATGAGTMDPAAAEEVFAADPGGIVAAVARPIGTVVRADGGYRVTGRWPFASGSSHATWLGGEVTIPQETGDPVIMQAIFPREQVTIIDTWDTVGLRGTASNDIAVEDVFAPDAHLFPLAEVEPTHDWPLYRCFPLIFMGQGSVMLGMASALIDDFVALANTKPGWGMSGPMAEAARVQAAVAGAHVQVQSARSYLYEKGAELWDDVERGNPGSAEARAELRLAICHAADASIAALERVVSVAGTGVIFRKSPMERRIRDLRTAGAHIIVSGLMVEAAGRVRLGRPAEMVFF